MTHPTRCSVCNSPHRAAIDAGHARGESGRSLAAKYHLKPGSVGGHLRLHLTRADSPPPPARPAGQSAIDELVELLHQHTFESPTAALAAEYRLSLRAQAEQGAAAPVYDVRQDREWLILRKVLFTHAQVCPLRADLIAAIAAAEEQIERVS